MNDDTLVDYQVAGAVATLRMNRPQALNAFNAPLRQALLAALDRAEREPAVKVVLLGSTGRGFSAGADLNEPKPDDHNVIDELLQGYRPLLEKIGRSPLPVIGVAPGVAAGVGAALLMACDLVIMAEEARIYMAFSHIGLVPDGGASWWLYQHLGYQRAFELIVEGGSLNAAQCLAMGIANKVVAGAGLDQAAQQWAAQIAQRSPLATAEAKKLLRAAATSRFAETVEQEALAQHLCIGSEASQAAIAAFRAR
jgi:2-(1,2-epoxy-1,2-dihydrophenyl)acetyl-CoA isomerase